MKIHILNIAHDLISYGWTKEAWARDKDGIPISCLDPRACYFCALGALQRAKFMLANSFPPSAAPDINASHLEALKHLELLVGTTLSIFNDSHSKEAVLSLFKKVLHGDRLL